MSPFNIYKKLIKTQLLSYLLTFLLFSSFSTICFAQLQDLNGIPAKDNPFEISIFDKNEEPIKDAIIRGGLDWTNYSAFTNDKGIAVLPGYAVQYKAFIYRNNFYPFYDSIPASHKLKLSRTSRLLDSIGVVLGNAIIFNDNEIVTLDYIGNYRVYKYDDSHVENFLTVNLGDSVIAITHTELHADTLWISTHASGIYSFYIGDNYKPRLISHYAVDGKIKYFLIWGEFIIVAQHNYLRVLSAGKENNYNEIQKLKTSPTTDFRDRQSLKIIGNYLFLISFTGQIEIYDISDPYSFKLTWNEELVNYVDFLFYKTYLIRRIENRIDDLNANLQYDVMDISNPEKPENEKSFFCKAQIKGFTSDNCAYGFWCGNILFTIADGSIEKGFKVNGIYTQEGEQTGYEELGGVHYPYYLFKGKLLKLK